MAQSSRSSQIRQALAPVTRESLLAIDRQIQEEEKKPKEYRCLETTKLHLKAMLKVADSSLKPEILERIASLSRKIDAASNDTTMNGTLAEASLEKKEERKVSPNATVHESDLKLSEPDKEEIKKMSDSVEKRKAASVIAYEIKRHIISRIEGGILLEQPKLDEIFKELLEKTDPPEIKYDSLAPLVLDIINSDKLAPVYHLVRSPKENALKIAALLTIYKAAEKYLQYDPTVDEGEKTALWVELQTKIENAALDLEKRYSTKYGKPTNYVHTLFAISQAGQVFEKNRTKLKKIFNQYHQQQSDKLLKSAKEKIKTKEDINSIINKFLLDSKSVHAEQNEEKKKHILETLYSLSDKLSYMELMEKIKNTTTVYDEKNEHRALSPENKLAIIELNKKQIGKVYLEKYRLELHTALNEFTTSLAAQDHYGISNNRFQKMQEISFILENMMALKKDNILSDLDKAILEKEIKYALQLLRHEALQSINIQMNPNARNRESLVLTLAQKTVALIIKSLFDCGESSSNLIDTIQRLGNSSENFNCMEELDKVALHFLEEDSDVQREFLDKLNCAFINKAGIKKAYSRCKRNDIDPTERTSLIYTILKDAQATSLSDKEIIELAHLVPFPEVIECIKKNNSLEQNRKITLLAMLSNVGDKSVELKKMTEKYKHNRNPVLKNKKLGDLKSQVDHISSYSAYLFKLVSDADPEAIFIYNTLLNNENETQIINDLSWIASKLKKSVEAIDESAFLSDEAKQSESKRNAEIAAREQSVHVFSDAPAARIIMRTTTTETKKASLGKKTLMTIVKNHISTLLILKTDNAYTAIDGIIKKIGKTETVLEVFEALPNPHVKLLFAQRFFSHHYKTNMEQNLIDKFINGIAANNPDQMFEIFCGCKKNDREKLALGILESQEMRPWLLTHKLEFKSILSAVSPQDEDKLSPSLSSQFSNWSKPDCDTAISLCKRKHAILIHWGILTSPDAVTSCVQEENLKSYLDKLDLSKLTAAHIKKIDKRARIAYLDNLRSWDAGKQMLGGDPIDLTLLRERTRAFTHDFTEGDITSLASETGLIASFENHMEKVTSIITHANTDLARKAGGHLLNELGDEQGFMNNEEMHNKTNETPSRLRLGRSYRHQIMVTSLYHYTGKDGYTFNLNKSNNRIQYELKRNPNNFLAQATTFSAFNVIFQDPLIVGDLREEKRLIPYATKAAELVSSSSDLLSTIKQLRKKAFKLRDSSAAHANHLKEASDELLKALPTFLAKNTKFENEDILEIEKLHNLYRQLPEQATNEYKTADDYKQDPVIAALLKNPDLTGAKEKALGLIIFSDKYLAKGFLKQCENYELPEPWFQKQFWRVVTGILVGSAIAGIASYLTHVLNIINPFSWMSSIWNYFQGVSAATGVFSGAAAGAAVAVAVPTLWERATGWIRNIYNHLVGARPEGESEFQTIEYGLLYADPAVIKELLLDETSRANLAKMLLYCEAKGFNISQSTILKPEIRAAMANLSYTYFMEQNPHWRLIVEVSSWALLFGFGFFLPPSYRSNQLNAYVGKAVKENNESQVTTSVGLMMKIFNLFIPRTFRSTAPPEQPFNKPEPSTETPALSSSVEEAKKPLEKEPGNDTRSTHNRPP